jgi:hypothetical protein
VKNQRRSETGVWQINRGADFPLLDFSQSREKASGGSAEPAAPGGASEACANAPLRGAGIACGDAPGAFRTGIVKNQRRSETGVLQISRKISIQFSLAIKWAMCYNNKWS